QFEKVLEITFAHRFSFGNSATEQRLSEGWFVALIVAEPAIAIHVNHDIAGELETKIHREADDLCNGFGVLPIHMENGNLKHLRHISGIGAGTPLAGPRSKTNLVIDDYVERAADCVGVELA